MLTFWHVGKHAIIDGEKVPTILTHDRSVMWYPWSWTTHPFLPKLAEGKVWRTPAFFRGKTNCFWFQFLTNQSIAFRFQGMTKNILELDGPGMAVTSNSYGPIPISILSHEPKEQKWKFVFAKAQVFQFLPWINLKMISPFFMGNPQSRRESFSGNVRNLPPNSHDWRPTKSKAQRESCSFRVHLLLPADSWRWMNHNGWVDQRDGIDHLSISISFIW